MAALEYWLWLSSVGLRPRGKAALLERFGDPEAVFRAPAGSFEEIEGIGKAEAVVLERRDLSLSEEIREALHDSTAQIADAVHGVLEKTPPELAADITTRGIVFTGGGSLLSGLTELIEERTGINVMVAENPADCVAIGAGKYVEMMDRLGRIDYM